MLNVDERNKFETLGNFYTLSNTHVSNNILVVFPRRFEQFTMHTQIYFAINLRPNNVLFFLLSELSRCCINRLDGLFIFPTRKKPNANFAMCAYVDKFANIARNIGIIKWNIEKVGIGRRGACFWINSVDVNLSAYIYIYIWS